MGRRSKTGFSSYKKSGFECDVVSRSQRIPSVPVNPKFWTQVPRTRGKRPKLGQKWIGVLKLVSNHTKTVDLNGMFYQEAKEHILSQWIPNFEPRFPIPGGERPKMGQKWVGVLRLVSHHTKRVDLNGMLNQGAKEHILSQWTQNLGHEFPVPGVIGPNWVKNGSSN